MNLTTGMRFYMQSIQQALVTFFEQVAEKNSSLFTNLKQEQSFTVEPHCWSFTLPSLHAYLQHQDDMFNRIEYKQFRQLIFSSPINQSVKLHGAEITITENRGKVDKSTYAMIWPSGKKEAPFT